MDAGPSHFQRKWPRQKQKWFCLKWIIGDMWPVSTILDSFFAKFSFYSSIGWVINTTPSFLCMLRLIYIWWRKSSSSLIVCPLGKKLVSNIYLFTFFKFNEKKYRILIFIYLYHECNFQHFSFWKVDRKYWPLIFSSSKIHK